MKVIFLAIALIILNGFVLVDAASFGYSSTEDFSVNVNTYVGNLTNLSEMTDVNIPAPTDEQVLSWDSATTKWVASTLSYISKWVINTANGFFYTSGNTLYFNDTLLNNTIDDRAVTTESDPYWTANQSSYSTTAEIIGFNYWNDTYATFNKTYGDLLYYGLNNPYGYYNSTNPQTETDPIYVAQNTTIVRIGDCPSGQVVVNITTGGVECSSAGAGDITNVQGDNIYIYNGSDSGNVQLSFNETKLNDSVEAFGYITSYAETDPYWTANQSSYSTTAEILAFGYYNSSDFVITDYFTTTQI